MFKDSADTDFFNHTRALEDLASTFGVFRGSQSRHKSVRFPMALLHRLGKDILNATVEDHGAWRLHRDLREIRMLAKERNGAGFDGRLEYSCAIAAVILARTDLAEKFMPDGRFSFDAGLRWFVLHGIAEHRLWHLLSENFIRQLITVPRDARYGRLSPLQHIVLGERADHAMRFGPPDRPDFHAAFDKWLLADGVNDYKLFWCLNRRQRRSMRKSEALRLAGALIKKKQLGETVRRWFKRKQVSAAGASISELKRMSAEQNELSFRLARILQNRWQDGLPFEPLSFASGEGGEQALDAGFVGPANRKGVAIVSDGFGLVLPMISPDHGTLVLEFLDVANAQELPTIISRVDGRISVADVRTVPHGQIVHIDISSARIDGVPPHYRISLFRVPSVAPKGHSGAAQWGTLSRAWAF